MKALNVNKFFINISNRMTRTWSKMYSFKDDGMRKMENRFNHPCVNLSIK